MVLTAGLLTSVAADTPLASANVNGSRPDIGVQFHGLWTSFSDDQRIAVLDRMRGAGMTTVRIDAAWAMLQPYNGWSYDPWGTAFLDRIIKLCNDRGITPLITLWLTPGWANNHAGTHTLPTNVADYARVAQWVANRYTNRVGGWEVWNEPNSRDFLTGADPGAYTNLLRAAYPAFHAGYPGTTVVFGGLEYNDTAWLSRAYAAGAHGSFDVMATHPYMGRANLPPSTPDDGTPWTLMHAKAVRDLMVANGDGEKSLWFTEFGWSSHDNAFGTPNYELGVTEAQQAQYLTETVWLIRNRLTWVGKVYWYAAPYSGVTTEQKWNYNPLRADMSPKPVMDAIFAATH